MSTFTTFNGPQQGPTGPTLAQLTALIDAYNKLSTQLQAHIEKTVSEVSDVHNVKNYVDYTKSTITNDYTHLITSIVNRIDEQISVINDALSTKANTDIVALQLEQITNSINVLQEYVDTLVNENDFNDAINNINLSLTTIQESLDDFIAHWSIDEDTATFDGSIKAEVISGKVEAHDSIDFTRWAEFQAPYAGTGGLEAGTNGVYVLGCLSEDWKDDPKAPISNKYKPSRVFVKYLNTEPFDAIIDAVVSEKNGTYTGSLTVNIAKQAGTWEDLAFHIVRGTGTQGQETVDKLYLCVSAKNLAIENSSGVYSVTQAAFKTAGINFCAVKQDGFVMPNGMLHGIATCKIGTDVAAGFAASNFIGGGPGPGPVPVGTGIPVGGMIRWLNSNTIPADFMMCDGNFIEAANYPELAAALGETGAQIRLPIETYSIIRVK